MMLHNYKFNYHPEFPTTEFQLTNGVKAAIQNEGDGLSLFIEGFADPVAYLDLYYFLNGLIPGGEEYHRQPAMQLVIGDTQHLEGDPVAFIKFEPDGTRVAFETGVSQVETDQQYGAMYGYPITPDA
jgi:hypothetical protein